MVEEGKSHLETLEKDFFFRRGGGAAWRIRGSGGGGGGRERSERLEWEGAAKVAWASVKDFSREGMCTVFEGAVCGRCSVGDGDAREEKDDLDGAAVVGANGITTGNTDGIGSERVSTRQIMDMYSAHHLSLEECSVADWPPDSLDDC